MKIYRKWLALPEFTKEMTVNVILLAMCLIVVWWI